jgi:hypothetical protein
MEGENVGPVALMSDESQQGCRLAAVLRRWVRYLFLIATAIFSIALGILDVGYHEWTNTLTVAKGLHPGRITALYVGPRPWYTYNTVWVKPPAALARKLEAALAASRHPGWFGGLESPSAALKVRYSDGFVAIVPIDPMRNRVRIFYSHPSDFFSISREIPSDYCDSPLKLTPSETRWMDKVGRYHLSGIVGKNRDE